MRWSFRDSVLLLFVLGLSAISLRATAEENAIEIYEGFAKTISIGGTAATVAVGNPEIVDATSAGGQTILLTAKARGATNISFLDQDGRLISAVTVRVEPAMDKADRIFVRAGRSRYEYFCKPGCDPVGPTGQGGRPAPPSNSQPKE